MSCVGADLDKCSSHGLQQNHTPGYPGSSEDWRCCAATGCCEKALTSPAIPAPAIRKMSWSALLLPFALCADVVEDAHVIFPGNCR